MLSLCLFVCLPCQFPALSPFSVYSQSPVFCVYYTKRPPFPILRHPEVTASVKDSWAWSAFSKWGAWLLVALWHFRAITLQWFYTGWALQCNLVTGKVHTCLSTKSLMSLHVTSAFTWQIRLKQTNVGGCNSMLAIKDLQPSSWYWQGCSKPVSLLIILLQCLLKMCWFRTGCFNTE